MLGINTDKENGALKSWKVFFSKFEIPKSFEQIQERIQANLLMFQNNYIMILFTSYFILIFRSKIFLISYPFFYAFILYTIFSSSPRKKIFGVQKIIFVAIIVVLLILFVILSKSFIFFYSLSFVIGGICLAHSFFRSRSLISITRMKNKQILKNPIYQKFDDDTRAEYQTNAKRSSKKKKNIRTRLKQIEEEYGL
jgi:predicted membrane protein